MKTSKTIFNKIKRVFSQIEVKKGIVNFFPDGVFELPTEDPESMLEKDESIVFYGGDGNEIFLESLLWPLKKEVQENINIHIDNKEKLKYLNEVIDLFSSIEDNIEEDDNGNLCADFIKFKDFSIDELNERDRGMYKSFVLHLKESLREALLELYTIYNPLTINVITSDEKIKKPNSTKSFTLNKRLLYSKEFKVFAVELKKHYVDYNDFIDFRHVFSGELIDKKVVWNESNGALKYFIRKLIKKRIIKSDGSFYKTTAYCFKYKTEGIQHDVLMHDHEPEDKKLTDDIDYIISIIAD